MTNAPGSSSTDIGDRVDWSSVPTFGTCPDRDACVIRPSAYGLIVDERAWLAVARDRQGLYLPGGGIEVGETPAQTIAREALEECGLVTRLSSWSLCAVQFVFSAAEQTHFQKRSVFIGGTFSHSVGPPAEPDYQLHWTTPENAIAVLSDASQRWAVEQWLSARLACGSDAKR